MRRTFRAPTSAAASTGTTSTSGFAPALFHASQNIDFFGTVRGRLGYAFGSALIYATGGFAYANVDTTVNFSNGFNVLNSNQLETGWVAGGGVEYLFAPCWSAKVEYQFIDLGNQTISEVAADGVLIVCPSTTLSTRSGPASTITYRPVMRL